MTLWVRRATLADLRAVPELFDGYRQFYKQPADYHLADAFIRNRLANDESVVFLAIDRESGAGLGFVQLEL